MKEYLKMWKGFADFRGRSNRTEFWLAGLIHVMIIVLLILIGLILDNTPLNRGFTLFFLLFTIVAVIPWTALSVRRLHDIDKSGVLVLLYFVPFGNLALLYYFTQDTKEGFNKWVPDKNAPKIREDERDY